MISTLMLVAWPPSALAMEEPEHWSDIGTVEEWMEWDARFYRLYESNPYQDVSHYEWEQDRIWEDSKSYRSPLAEPLSLEAYRALPPEKQESYRKLAAGELKYVARLRNIQLQRLQRARENLPTESLDTTGWPLIMTDSLQKLKASLALDPENFYAWHLRGYFLICCGDVQEAQRSLLMAVKALGAAGEDGHRDIKRRIMLDLAWLERNQGRPEQAARRLDAFERLGKRTDESLLLRGLVAVQLGDNGAALEIATQMASRPSYQFPTSYETAAMVPMQIDIQRWKPVSSGYIQNWLTALVALRDGDIKGARLNFPEHSIMRYYPFAQYFWNDAAMIYDRTGRPALAEQARDIAGLSRPWFYYLADRPYGLRLGALTGGTGPVVCYVGYNRFYQAGSRLAFAAMLLGQLPAIADPTARQAQAGEALEQLEICQRTDHYPGQAGILKGQVYYVMGDDQSAVAELKDARVFLLREGDEANLAAVKKDLETLEANLSAAGLERFFGQSGASQGRWAAVPDPAAHEAQLRARVDSHPDDEAARLDLARHLIRNGEAEAGRRLAMGLYRPEGQGDVSRQVVTLILEAERSLGQTEMAEAMLRQLDRGRGDEWPDAGLWSLVGAICQDHDRPEDARRALETALRMDPDNRGIKNLLKMMN